MLGPKGFLSSGKWCTRATNGCFESRALRCHENPYGAFENPYVAHRSVFRMGPDPAHPRMTYDCLRAFYGPKIVGSPCWKVVQATGSMLPIRVEKSCGLARHVMGLPTGSLVFYPYGARELFGSFMWPRHLGDFVLPRAIDSYHTQTRTGSRPPVDLMWPSII